MFNFLKKERKSASKAIDDAQVVTNDFVRPIPYWSYRPVAYKSYKPLDTLIPVLDSYLERLFNGEIDEGNADVLDNIIYDYANQAMSDISNQRVAHISIIKDLYFNHVGIVRNFEKHLEEVRMMKEMNDEEYQSILDRYNNQKFKEERQHE